MINGRRFLMQIQENRILKKPKRAKRFTLCLSALRHRNRFDHSWMTPPPVPKPPNTP